MIPTTSLLGLLIVLSTTSTIKADTHLYPFGETAGDDKLPVELDGSSPKLTTSHKFQVFQSRDRRIYVNVNGAVSLHAPFPQWYTRKLPFSPDIFIAAFWIDHYLSDLDFGVVWYRLSREKKDIRRGKNDVRANFEACGDTFKPKRVLVATWENVHSLGYLLETYPHVPNPRNNRDTEDQRVQRRHIINSNTYQVVLLTDGKETFVILNYQKIGWVSSFADFAVVGFNAGDGINSYEHPLSGTADLDQLVSGSNLNPAVPGRWMYKISGDKILAPGCDPV